MVSHFVPGHMDGNGVSFKVESNRNKDGTVHFIVQITKTAYPHFGKEDKCLLGPLIETESSLSGGGGTEIKMFIDVNSATCHFDAPANSNLCFFFWSGYHVHCLKLQDFMPK